MRRFFVLLSTVICISCSDEFNLFNDEIDLLTDFEETTILYANISSANHKHFIRVNKGFLGESFYDLSSDITQIQYLPEEIDVEFKVFNGETIIRNYYCKDTLIDKEDGEDFNTEKVIAYYFVEPNLPDQSTDIRYKIVVRTPENVVYSITHPMSNYKLKKDVIFYNEVDLSHRTFRSFTYNEVPFGYQYIIDAYVKYWEIARQQDTVFYDVGYGITKKNNYNYPKEDTDDEFVVTFHDQDIIDGVINDIHKRGNPDVLKRQLVSIYFVTTVVSYDLYKSFHAYGNSGFSHDYNPDILNNVINGYGLFTTYYTDTTETASFKLSTHYFMEEQYEEYDFDHVQASGTN